MSAELPDVAEMVSRLFPRKRSTLTVSIDLDPVPGWGHNAEDHRAWLQATLDSAMGHYNPLVELAGSVQTPDPAQKDGSTPPTWPADYEDYTAFDYDLDERCES